MFIHLLTVSFLNCITNMWNTKMLLNCSFTVLWIDPNILGHKTMLVLYTSLQIWRGSQWSLKVCYSNKICPHQMVGTAIVTETLVSSWNHLKQMTARDFTKVSHREIFISCVTYLSDLLFVCISSSSSPNPSVSSSNSGA